MNRPQQPHQPFFGFPDSDAMWAAFDATDPERADWHEVGHRLADEPDPRPEDERNPRNGGPVLAALMVAGAFVLVGIGWLGLVALEAIAGTF